MRIPATIKAHQPKFIEQAWQQLSKVINNNVSFGNGQDSDNIRGTWINVTTPVTPDTDFVVVHNLGQPPVGVDLKLKSAACDVYTGSVAPTATEMTLRSTGSAVVVRLFIH